MVYLLLAVGVLCYTSALSWIVVMRQLSACIQVALLGLPFLALAAVQYVAVLAVCSTVDIAQKRAVPIQNHSSQYATSTNIFRLCIK